MTKKSIFLKDENVSLVIRSYKTSKMIKAYYKGNVLYISKPVYVTLKEIESFIKKYEENLYDEYVKIKKDKNLGIKKWANNEKILYKGKEYGIVTSRNTNNLLQISINDKEKLFCITSPWGMNEDLRTESILKLIKKLFKNNTENIIEERLDYWSRVTGIKYNSWKVHDATTRYGSCVKSKKALNFSSRLIMLPMDKIDAVIVHELCHIEQPNHSEKFYNLVENYIPNYKEIDSWLRKNGNLLNM